MALAEMTHHSAPRRQMTARAGGGVREMFDTAAFRKMPPPRRLVPGRYFAMDAGEDVGEAPAARRPAPLLEVLPQEQEQRRTVEQIVDPFSEVPMLHVFVPQMVDQLVGALLHRDTPILEHAIFEVPKRFSPQKAEELEEAPTLVSLVDVIRQPLDIPVRAWGGTGGRLQGFLPGQSSSSSVEQNADIPVPHLGIYGGCEGFHPGQSSTAVAEQIASQFRMVAGTSKVLVSHRFPKKLLGKRFKGFLALPQRKKVRRCVRTRGRN